MNDYSINKTMIYAIQNDNDVWFVSGFGPYNIPSDWTYGKDTHLTAASLAYYHAYAKQHPELHLGQKLSLQILDVLNDQCYYILPYLIFKVMDEEIKIEQTEKAGFKFSEEITKTILVELKKQISRLAEDYKTDTSRDGQGFKDGLYGYMSMRSQELEKVAGITII